MKDFIADTSKSNGFVYAGKEGKESLDQKEEKKSIMSHFFWGWMGGWVQAAFVSDCKKKSQEMS